MGVRRRTMNQGISTKTPKHRVEIAHATQVRRLRDASIATQAARQPPMTQLIATAKVFILSGQSGRLSAAASALLDIAAFHCSDVSSTSSWVRQTCDSCSGPAISRRSSQPNACVATRQAASSCRPHRSLWGREQVAEDGRLAEPPGPLNDLHGWGY
jgi:hypothetical protein